MVTNADIFNAYEGSLWVQPDGPNTQPQYLKCHTLDDIDEPFGGVTLHRCPNPRGPGWVTIAKTQDPPDLVTTSVTTPLGRTADWLEQQYNCSMGVYVHMRKCEPKNAFLNYERGFLLRNAVFTSKGLSNLVAREGSDLSEQSFDLTADPGVVRYYSLDLTRQTTTETEKLYDIAFCNSPRCAGPCGPAMDDCEVGFIVAAAGAAAAANVLYTADSGATWTEAAANPFDADEDIISVVCFPLDQDTTRVVVARGTTDGANPAEIAYSDDNGANWTAVNVGDTDGEFAQWSGALFAIDRYNIWLVTDQGAIYFSDDAAESWTEQATSNTNGLNYVNFVDENHGVAVGDSNTLITTSDGGEHWDVTDGPSAGDSLMCVEMIDEQRWWVGDDDGAGLNFTLDGGDNWTARAFTVPTMTSEDTVNDIMFWDEYVGFAVVTCTSGTGDRGAMMRTFDGGYTWETFLIDTDYDSDSPAGPYAVWACNPNLAYSVGDPIDLTGSTYTVSE
jgi:photosystem II stability/assembly factor-like uncharacterized protein